MNHYQTSGILMSITLPSDADAKRGRVGNMVIKYGGRRDKKTKAPRQFVNAVPMRIPSKLVKNFREYEVGTMVEIMGRLEGVIDKGVGGNHHGVQLVANTIRTIEMADFGFKLIPAPAKHADRPPVGAESESDPTEAGTGTHEEEEGSESAATV